MARDLTGAMEGTRFTWTGAFRVLNTNGVQRYRRLFDRDVIQVTTSVQRGARTFEGLRGGKGILAGSRQKRAKHSPPHPPPSRNRILSFPRPDLYRSRVPEPRQRRTLEVCRGSNRKQARGGVGDGFRLGKLQGTSWLWREGV